MKNPSLSLLGRSCGSLHKKCRLGVDRVSASTDSTSWVEFSSVLRTTASGMLPRRRRHSISFSLEMDVPRGVLRLVTVATPHGSGDVNSMRLLELHSSGVGSRTRMKHLTPLRHRGIMCCSTWMFCKPRLPYPSK